MLCNLGISG
jgi:parallel beta-helix repeat protein